MLDVRGMTRRALEEGIEELNHLASVPLLPL